MNRKTLGLWHFISVIQKAKIWKNAFMIIVSGKAFYFSMKYPCKINFYDSKEEAERAERMEEKAKRIEEKAGRIETELMELKNLLKESVNKDSES